MCLKKSVVIMNATLQFLYIYIYILVYKQHYKLPKAFILTKKKKKFVKGLVTELTSPPAQNAWGFRGERVQDAGLTACYNYFSKKKKKHYKLISFLCLFSIYLFINVRIIVVV